MKQKKKSRRKFIDVGFKAGMGLPLLIFSLYNGNPNAKLDY